MDEVKEGDTVGMTELVRGIGEWLDASAAVVGALASGLLVVLLAWRASSFHPILMQMWRLLLGRLVVSSSEIRDFIQQRDDLVRFRFVSGIRARTLGQAERVSRWAKENDEDLAAVRTCGKLFDLEECRLHEDRIPSPRVQGTRAVVAMCSLLCLIFALVGVATDRALVQFKGSGAFFVLAADFALSVDGTERITIESCNTPTENLASRLTPTERTVLCNTLGKPVTRDYVRRTVHQQRWLMIPTSFGLAYLFVLLVHAYRSGEAARAMSRRRNDRTFRAGASRQQQNLVRCSSPDKPNQPNVSSDDEGAVSVS